MPFHIRAATSDDAPSLAPLLAEVNDLHAAALPDRFRRVPAGPELAAFLRAQIAEEDAHVLVAEEADAPLGYLVATLHETPPTPIAYPRRYAEIDTLVVVAAARRRGVGTALMDHAHAWLASQVITDVQLVVYEFNDDARRFYERLGYATRRRALWRQLAAPPKAPPIGTTSRSAPPDPKDHLGSIDVTIDRALLDDAEHLLKLQYLCYQTEAALYDDWSIPPLTEPLSELRRAIDTDLVLAARLGPEVVGSVRGRLVDGTCHVGRLVVHPRLRRRGLATRLVTGPEQRFPDAERFALFTGHRSDANLRLYRRLGYAASRREIVSPSLDLVHLEKRVART